MLRERISQARSCIASKREKLVLGRSGSSDAPVQKDTIEYSDSSSPSIRASKLIQRIKSDIVQPDQPQNLLGSAAQPLPGLSDSTNSHDADQSFSENSLNVSEPNSLKLASEETVDYTSSDQVQHEQFKENESNVSAVPDIWADTEWRNLSMDNPEKAYADAEAEYKRALEEYLALDETYSDYYFRLKDADGINLKEMEAQLDAMEQQVSEKEAWFTEIGNHYQVWKDSEVANQRSPYYDPEFERKSEYVISNDYENDVVHYDSLHEIIADYINGGENVRSYLEKKLLNIALSGDKPLPELERMKAYRHLTNNEIRLFNYYSSISPERGLQYLNNLDYIINKRIAEQQFSDMEGKSIREIMYGAKTGIESFYQDVESFKNFKDSHIVPSATQMTAELARKDLSDVGNSYYNVKDREWQPFDIAGKSLGQAAFDLTRSVAYELPSELAKNTVSLFHPVGGLIVGAGLSGAASAGNSYQEMLNLGYGKKQARAYSTLVGASEASLQYVLGYLVKQGSELTKDTVGSFVKKLEKVIGKAAVEYGQTFLDGLSVSFLQNQLVTPALQNIVLQAENDLSSVSEEDVQSSFFDALLDMILNFGENVNEYLLDVSGLK